MRKKNLFFLVAMVFILATLIGCSSNDGSKNDKTIQQKATDTKEAVGEKASEVKETVEQKASETKKNVEQKTGELLDSAGNKISETGKNLKEDSKK